MTKEEKIIATAFTRIMFIDGSYMGLLYEYMEKKVGHGVIDLMLADKCFWEELHRACEKDFIDMISKEQPSLPSNIDEAAIDFADNARKQLYSKDYAIASIADYDHGCIDGFKAGAEWQKEQMLKEAVNGYVTFNVDAQKEELPCVTVIADEKPLEFYDNRGFKLGDKVRIIIVKEKK